MKISYNWIKEFVDIKDLWLPGGIEPGGQAVRGQHDAVLVISCQGLGHESFLRKKSFSWGCGPGGPLNLLPSQPSRVTARRQDYKTAASGQGAR